MFFLIVGLSIAGVIIWALIMPTLINENHKNEPVYSGVVINTVVRSGSFIGSYTECVVSYDDGKTGTTKEHPCIYRIGETIEHLQVRGDYLEVLGEENGYKCNDPMIGVC